MSKSKDWEQVDLIDYEECLKFLKPKNGCGLVAMTAMLARRNRYKLTNISKMRELRDGVLKQFQYLTQFYDDEQRTLDRKNCGIANLNETAIAFALKYGFDYVGLWDKKMTLTDVWNEYGECFAYSWNKDNRLAHLVYLNDAKLYGAWDARFCRTDKRCICEKRSTTYHQVLAGYALVSNSKLGEIGKRYIV